MSFNIIYLFTYLYYYEIVHEIIQLINSCASDAENFLQVKENLSERNVGL